MIKENETMSDNKLKTSDKQTLLIKSGATDMRRNEKSLGKMLKERMCEEIKANSLYAFANKNVNIVKVVHYKEDGSVSLFKNHAESKIAEWPKYQEKGNAGYTIRLTGKEKNNFLKSIGCPKDL
jgi:hypothetical protein